MIFNNIIETVGNTPVVQLKNIKAKYNLKGNIYAKVESFNPLSSVKDRIAKKMILQALEDGTITKDTVLVEPTSGNTGIGLSFVAASLGMKLILVMPDTMSIERRKIVVAFGAELVLTPGAEGMKGAIKKAQEISEQDNHFTLGQFDNLNNPQVHRETTGPEIVEDFKNIGLDFFVSAVGTGGTITGAGEVLKNNFKDIKIVAIEPRDSKVLQGEAPGPHKIQGIGAGFIPEVLNVEVIDQVIDVSNDEALEFGRELTKTEGVFSGISGGAALFGAIELAKENDGNILFILPDTGERYLSTMLYEI